MNCSTRAIQVWNLSDPAQTSRLSFAGEIRDLVFSPDGRLLTAANAAGTVKMWEVPGFSDQMQFQAHAHPVSALAFSADSRRLATANEGGKIVRLWDVDTRQELITLPCESPNVQQLLFTSDGSQLVARTPGDFVFWRAPSFAEIEAKEKRTRR
jgi:WD40 repeat protein